MDNDRKISHERSYRKVLSEEVVLRQICGHAGRQFDPEIALAFVEKVLGKSW